MDQAFTGPPRPTRPPSAARQISVSPAPLDGIPLNEFANRPKTPLANNRILSDNNVLRQSIPTAPTTSAAGDKGPQSASEEQGVFHRIVHTIWRTKHTREHTDQNDLAKTTLRELIVYLGFILLLCLIVFGQMTSTQYRFTNAMRELFVEQKFSDDDLRTFSDISDTESLWLYLQGPMLAGLYPTVLYNGQALSDAEMGYLLRENKLLGLPRMRQVLVGGDSCSVPKAFSSQITQCYAPYEIGLEYRTDITPSGSIVNSTADAYKYNTEEKLGGMRYWGKVATYSAGGFIQTLSKNYSVATEVVNSLKANLWLQRGARVLFVDFTVYNANVNLFNIIRLVFEFPASGGAIVTNRLLTLKFIRLATDWDRFVFACQIIFVIFTAYYVGEEVVEILHMRRKYFKMFWSWIDMLVIILSSLSIGLFFWREREIDDRMQRLVDEQDKYADFEALSFWSYFFDTMAACTIFLAWIKIFKYISFNKTMTQLAATLSASAADLLGFSVMFFIVFLAYAQLGYLVLGPSVAEFHTFEESIFTLFRIILGDLNFEAIRNSNRVFGPIYFISFVFFCFFILFNMFIAIINDAYRKVKLKLADAKSDFQLGGLIKRGFARLVDRLTLKRKVVADVDHALQTADENRDGNIDYSELKKNLTDRGRAEEEVRALFDKYDLDGNRVLDEREQKLLEDDMKELKDSLDVEERRLYKEAGVPIPDSVTASDIELVKRRIARLEHAIGGIVGKMDAILVKLEDMASVRGPPPAFDPNLFSLGEQNDSFGPPGFSAPSTPQSSPATTRRNISKLASNEAIERNIGFSSSRA